MKKQTVLSFLCGALLFGSAGVFAGQYMATDNPFPIQLNGKAVSIEGYNINDETYFKLRDIADAVGGFTVDFQNNTIQLSKDGYTYNSTPLYTVDIFSFLPDYGKYNNLTTSDYYEYNNGSAYYYEYTYDSAQVDSYINYLKSIGYTVYNQPSDISYNNNGSVQVYLAANTPVIELNGKYASLVKNDSMNCLELTVYGDKTPEEASSNTQDFINSTTQMTLDDFMKYTAFAGYEKINDYSVYNTYASINGLENKLIYVQGYISEVRLNETAIMAVLETYNAPEEKWLIGLSLTDYSSYQTLKDTFENKYVSIAGKYLGFSNVSSLPSMSFEFASIYGGGAYKFEDFI